VQADLKDPAAVARVRELLKSADVLVEGFRPGVMERLGLGPDICLHDNPRLVYGRITGWGQTGPLADRAGHDINYIAISGALHAIGLKDKPVAPLNIIGDYGGGAMLLLVGVLAALTERASSGKGQVVDAAMTDGAALLMSLIYELRAKASWQDEREANLLDGAASYYTVYECADGRHLAVGPIERQFYAAFIKALGTDDPRLTGQAAADGWEAQKEVLAEVFKTRSRDDWMKAFEGTDSCVSPVLSMDEAPLHPHNVARQTYVTREGIVQPAPAPRFSRTGAELREPGTGSLSERLKGWNIPAEVLSSFES
jgi:alpha-methylacyl-CoA racemase